MQETSSDTPRSFGGGTTPPFEETYRRFAPLLRKLAIRKFNVPPADAETLVHDVFATYITEADDVESVERYLIGSICNASRFYHHPTDTEHLLFCGETPCAATPTDAILQEVETMIRRHDLRRRYQRRAQEQ